MRVPHVVMPAVSTQDFLLLKYVALILKCECLQPVNLRKAPSATLRRIFAVPIPAASLVTRLCVEHQRMKHAIWRSTALEAPGHAPRMKPRKTVSVWHFFVSLSRFQVLRSWSIRQDSLVAVTVWLVQAGSVPRKIVRHLSTWTSTLSCLTFTRCHVVQCRTVGSALNLTRGCSQKGDTSCVVSCQSPDSP